MTERGGFEAALAVLRGRLLTVAGLGLVGACGGSTDGNASPSQNLPDVPVPEAGTYPVCVGENTTYTGPCCSDVHCYTPPGGAACPSAQEVKLTDIGVYAPGSGSCACGISGPYNSKSAQPYTDDAGACCYVAGTQSCMGRPLLVAGKMRLAPLVFGSRWSA